ncbi:MAG: 4-hydroxythreonine-4-phosphate dehydrogenase PdxA [Candidatus Nitrospinota bacterium M3_3B_026]
MKKKDSRLAVTSGDPAGIGPEVILKAFRELPKTVRRRVTVFGDIYYFRRLDKRLGTGVPIAEASSARARDDLLRVEDTGRVAFSASDFGKTRARFGRAAMDSINAAAGAVMEGRFNALVTAPISKEAVNLAGYRIPGHTEYLARLAGGVDVVMALACEKLKVAVATTHLPLRRVPGALTEAGLVKKMRLIDSSLKKMTGKRPRIAVLGLNPHASDGGLFGDEEGRIIEPAVRKARRAGVKAFGPVPADTAFTPRALGSYDIALAMYHDQGLIPVKLLGFGGTVNVTLGLPFLRVSVDHGTAFDIAGKNRADPRSMIHAVRTALNILSGRF